MRFFVLLLAVVGALAHPFPEDEGKESPLWVRSGKFQGDIMLTPEQERAMRNGEANPIFRWPNGVLPYRLRPGDFNNDQANLIRSSLEFYNTNTCVNIREANDGDGDNYVLVTREDSGCWSYVGNVAWAGLRPQQLNLQDNAWGTCLIPTTIQHEFLHAWGFYHQQSACGRDNYVNIHWENMQDGTSGNFDENCGSTEYGCYYDYESVMHYGKYDFSRNGQPTITARDNPDRNFGNGCCPTGTDVRKLNCMYQGYAPGCYCQCP